MTDREERTIVDLIGDVEALHRKFGMPPMVKHPGFLSEEDMEFRIKFLEEELEEIRVAYYEQGDLEQFLDGLLDLIYVAIGTGYLMNLPLAEGWQRVQSANLAKQRVEHSGESKRGSRLDLKKPPNWRPPTFRDLLNARRLKT